MKKNFSFVLAMCLAVSMIASFALIVPTSSTSSDPLALASIKVTDAAGYAAPYAAVDSAAAFVENQTAYVVACFTVKAYDYDSNIGTLNNSSYRTVKFTSSTLDLSYAVTTTKTYSVDGATGTILPYTLPGLATNAYDSTINTVTLKGYATSGFGFTQPAAESDYTNRYYLSFIAVTKPATSGEVTGTLSVASTAFSDVVGSATSLSVYDSTGLKYIIDRTIDTVNGDLYLVSSWNGLTKTELFGYHNGAGNATFGYIYKSTAYSYDAGGNLVLTQKITPDYYGKLVYYNAAGVLVDMTDTVTAVNAFFGFSFTNTDYPLYPSYFTDKTVGNPIVVSDTYSYVTAAVTVSDDDIDIAPTGDFSVNIVIVMAASAILAAAALAFVTKKARD